MVRVLPYVSGLINQELLLQAEYLAAENQVLRAHLPDRLRLTNDECSTLAEIGRRLGRRGLEKVASVARPESILGWFRKLVAEKFDGSKDRSYLGRPAIGPEVRPSSSRWRGRTPAGATIVSPVRWRTSDIRSRIKRWATYYDGTQLHLLRSGARPPHGRTSSHHTWRSPQEWTFLPPRFLPGEV